MATATRIVDNNNNLGDVEEAGVASSVEDTGTSSLSSGPKYPQPTLPMQLTYNDLINRVGNRENPLTGDITYFRKVSGGLFGKAKVEQLLLGPFVRSYEEGSDIIVLCFKNKSLKVPKTFIKKEGGTTILFKIGLPTPNTPAPTTVGSKELVISSPNPNTVSLSPGLQNIIKQQSPELQKEYAALAAKEEAERSKIRANKPTTGGRKSRRRSNKKKSTRRRKH